MFSELAHKMKGKGAAGVSSQMSSLRGVLLLTTTGIFSQIIGFIYRIFLTHLIGAEYLGLYQLLMPIYSVLLSLTSVGLTTAVSNLSARYLALGNTRAVYQIRCQALRLFFLLAILPAALMLAFSDAASVYLLGDARTQLGLLLLIPCLFLTGIENQQKYYFYGGGIIMPAAITELLEQLIRSGAALGFLLLFLPQGGEKTVGLIVCGMIVCEIFSSTTQTWLFHRYLPINSLVGEAPSPKVLRHQILAISIPMGATALLGNLIGSANSILIPRLLILGGMKPSAAMASFGVMFGMTLPMLMLPTAFLSALSLILVPRLSECAALGRKEEIRRRIRRTVAAANLILIPALSLLAVLGPELGNSLYRQPNVGYQMPALALGVLFACWQTLMSSALTGLNLQSTAAAIALFTDGIQLAITCLTVGNPKIGMLGYVWGFVLTAGLGAWLCWKRISRETSLRLPVYQWFAAPCLAALLGASCARLLNTICLNGCLSPLVSGTLALLFGLVLYASALQAQGVSLWKILKEKDLASSCRNG